ncbi:MAG: hypothetical protein M3463_04275 [Verrucomicrobiota bacterium]|nr:hypothetical protein [Verrucomicrobiota bacterium]
MKRMLSAALAWFCASMLAAGQFATPEPARGWKTAEGKPFQASLLSFDGTTVLLRMPNGSRAQAPLGKLSAEDQAYVAEWQKKQPIKVVLPDVVGVETAQIRTEVVSEDAAAEKFVYRTQHFEFESQGKFTQTLLREVARNFEATYELVKALPWGIEPKPPSGTHFRARLLKNQEAYASAGGPPNSTGFYSSRSEMFMIPFENIGVKVVGKSYAKDEDFDYGTMVHELTHQMMHFWLNSLPQWVVEGTAEYTSTLPLRNGKFRVSAAKGALKNYIDHLKKRIVGGVPDPYPLDQLFSVTNEQWSEILAQDPNASRRLYFTSYLLVYYFMHLDSKGEGQLFTRYFREVGETRKAIEEYRKALEEFKKQPGEMKHPEPPAVLASRETRAEFQKKTLQILLDGRSEAELMKQIRAAYAKLAIRL